MALMTQLCVRRTTKRLQERSFLSNDAAFPARISAEHWQAKTMSRRAPRHLMASKAIDLPQPSAPLTSNAWEIERYKMC